MVIKTKILQLSSHKKTNRALIHFFMSVHKEFRAVFKFFKRTGYKRLTSVVYLRSKDRRSSVWCINMKIIQEAFGCLLLWCLQCFSVCFLTQRLVINHLRQTHSLSVSVLPLKRVFFTLFIFFCLFSFTFSPLVSPLIHHFLPSPLSCQYYMYISSEKLVF